MNIGTCNMRLEECTNRTGIMVQYAHKVSPSYPLENSHNTPEFKLPSYQPKPTFDNLSLYCEEIFPLPLPPLPGLPSSFSPLYNGVTNIRLFSSPSSSLQKMPLHPAACPDITKNDPDSLTNHPIPAHFQSSPSSLQHGSHRLPQSSDPKCHLPPPNIFKRK